ncbi:EamA family transporter [Prauserella flavalba]|uniref:EamA family transporter n=1 Tax=Prauserella flavalba TaxID=1477506 RepID=UPI0036E4CC76
MSGRRAVPSPLRANTVRVTGSARTDPSGQPRGQRHPRGLEPAAPHGLRTAPVPATVAAVFLGLPPSALGFVVWGYAVARHPVTVATAARYLLPVVALALAYGWLGEVPRPVVLLGGALSILGVVLTHRRAPATGAVVSSRSPGPASRRRWG